VMSAGPAERYEGTDRTVLDEDVWSEQACAGTVTCPTCSFAAPPDVVRCPRCDALLLTACAGACGACTSRTCARGIPGDRR
jgi:hypothetical protein